MMRNTPPPLASNDLFDGAFIREVQLFRRRALDNTPAISEFCFCNQP